MVGRLYPIGFLETAEALEEKTQVAYSPVMGKIRQVTISWPDGCSFLVEALFLKGKVQFYPAQVLGNTLPQGIALNDHTLTTAMNQPVAEDDIVQLVIINHDSANRHSISAVVLIEEDENPLEEKPIK
jgi:hypothetical protein